MTIITTNLAELQTTNVDMKCQTDVKLCCFVYKGNFFAVRFSFLLEGFWRKRETNPIAADGGEDVEVARVDEVENDGVYGFLALLEPVGNSVLSLLGGCE